MCGKKFALNIINVGGITMILYDDIINILQKYNYSRQDILYMLRELQELDGENQIKEEYAMIISEKMGIGLAEIYEIITFYSMLNEKKQGKYIIEICTSGPCFVTKSKDILGHLENILGIKLGETSEDGMFTLKSSSCIGACDISPVIKIGCKLYGNLTKDKVEEIIYKLKTERGEIYA